MARGVNVDSGLFDFRDVQPRGGETADEMGTIKWNEFHPVHLSKTCVVPSDYPEFPDWWSSVDKTSRVFVCGMTDSGKTTTVNTLLFGGVSVDGKKGVPVPFDTLYYCVDKGESDNTAFVRGCCQKKMVDMWNRRPDMARYYERDGPNFKFDVLASKSLGDVGVKNLRAYPHGKSGPFNHTLIVIDDANLDEGGSAKSGKYSTLGYLLNMGRERGISVVYVTQGLGPDRKDGIDADQRAQFDTLVVCGSVRRMSHDVFQQLNRYVQDEEVARKMQAVMPKLQLGQFMLHNPRVGLRFVRSR